MQLFTIITYSVIDDGKVYGWGSSKQTGFDEDVVLPQLIETSNTVKEVCCGGHHTVLLTGIFTEN